MVKTYYFKHDSNARNDEKLLSLRMKHGMRGYGIYWAIIEKMREATDYKLDKDYKSISWDIRAKEPEVRSIVEEFGLFAFEGEKFYSKRLINDMNAMDNMRKGGRPKEKNTIKNANKVRARNTSPLEEIEKKDEEQLADASFAHDGNDDDFSSKFSPRVDIGTLADELVAEIKKCSTLSESAERLYGVSKEELAEYVWWFVDKLKMDGVDVKGRSDFRRHFNNWLRIQVNEKIKLQNNVQQQKNGVTDEYLRQLAAELESSGGLAF